MYVDPLLPVLCAVSLALLVVGFLFRRLKLPYVLGYLLAGVVLGPHAMALVTDKQILSQLGAIGVVLLLFYVGMEIPPARLLAVWQVSIGGTALQIAISVGCVWGLGAFLDWPLNRILLLGFVISLSSTAVVLPLVQGPAVSRTLADQVTGILIAQDIAIIPMVLALGLLRGEPPGWGSLTVQGLGAFLAVLLVLWIARKKDLRLGLGRLVGQDRELQVFGALIVCFGLSYLTGVLGLSTALGAFLAGMCLSAAKETEWIHGSLESFRVVFVALFFVSVGMLLDLGFLSRNWVLVAVLSLIVLATNTFINAGILRAFGRPWRDSLLGGAILAQVGELSYVLAAIGKQTSIVTDFAYQATIAVITVTLIATPVWTGLFARLVKVTDDSAATS